MGYRITETARNINPLTEYFSADKIRRWAACGTYGGQRGTYSVLMGKPEEKRQLRRPRRSWKDNIKMDVQEIGSGAWTGLIWLRKGTSGGLL